MDPTNGTGTKPERENLRRTLAQINGAKEAMRAEAMRRKQPIPNELLDGAAAILCSLLNDAGLYHAASMLLNEPDIDKDTALAIAKVGAASVAAS